MSQALAYVNGDFVELEKAKIDALDRGFIFGDGLYEVVAIFGGKMYQLDEHLQRYWDGAQEMMFENTPRPEDLKKAARELLQKTGIGEGIIYLEVTRGTAPRSHRFPQEPEPNVFMFAKEAQFPDGEKRTKGVKTILVPDERWNRCHVKSINLLPNCFYKEKAKRAGAYEAIQVHRLGITEGTSTNIYGVKDGVIYTAPAGPRILKGITRTTVLELAEQQGIEVVEKFMTTGELLSCDEVFLTSTTNKVLPINQVDQVTFPVDQYRVTFTLQEELEKHIIENRED
ncbi:aminotransferase class IV [Natranaerobius thermophilus]|uniref:Aminotransferase class IV n=1 Tax=Natranaerobius thermophilus (strain ATCC BAA-1301 / DSM 18059 / JW/NM-WN-LF) TaxID=457570 RepID=B2A6U4_NATTJ|nr:aminotransferase class IV [Natranaerobius thermophilus]ACB84225.1 aminotransferase class IV [Natranaerobius thermophilus JW/NM-WN-LF]